MGTSWVAVSINNITTRASREMTSRKNIIIFDFNGVNVAKHWHVAGEVLPFLVALLQNVSHRKAVCKRNHIFMRGILKTPNVLS